MLSEASYEMTDAAFGKKNKADEVLLVIFSEDAIQDHNATIQEGRPIFKAVPFITIMVPGDKDSIVHRKASQMDLDRFPHQYAAFKNKQVQETAGGTPLAAIPLLSQVQVKELQFFNCYTVEQLANMPDSQAANFREIHALKALAKGYLEQAAGLAPLVKVQAELAQRDTQLAETQSALNDLAARFKALEAKVLEKVLADEPPKRAIAK